MHDLRYSPTMHEIVEKLLRVLSQSVDGLSSQDTQVRRGPDKWTIQQIVEHLTLSYATTFDVVIARVATGTPTKGTPSLPQRIAQFVIATWGYFPNGYVAPLVVTPQEIPVRGLAGTELIASIDESLLRMDGALTAAEGLFGATRRSITHMRLGPMSVNQWRKFHLAHGKHHLKQILATRSLL